VQWELSEMAQALAEFYGKEGAEAGYSDEFLAEVLEKKEHRQACVARIKSRFYRCFVVETNMVSMV